jgi:hypothetical protein
LGCNKVYLSGVDLLFRDGYDHYHGGQLYRDNELRCKPRNKSLLVEIERKGKKYTTAEYFLESAEWMNEVLIPKICKSGGLEVYDFSHGLLSNDIQVDFDEFFGEAMRLVFDIDGVICDSSDGDYYASTPHQKVIDAINKLYDAGHTVILHTARGMGSCCGDQQEAYMMWFSHTKKQLQEWGLKFHQLYLGKPEGDYYIDDRALQYDNGQPVENLLEKLL